MSKRDIFLVSQKNVERHIKYYITYLRVPQDNFSYDIAEMEDP